ncbi:MAG: glycosyltransferase [Armatimonadota bacterium]
MRVLLISHTCQSATEGQPKAQCLGRLPGVDLRVLSPNRWLHYGQWRAPEVPAEAAFDYQVGKVTWPWVGPAQYFLHWYPEMARLLRDFRPDVIDLWEEPWSLVSAHTCFLRKRILPEAKLVSETEQNIDKHLPPPFETFRTYTLRNADFVVGRSAEAAEIVHRKGYKGPSAVVPNAVDTDLFYPMDKDKCRMELGFQGFVVGYVGRLVEEKGLSDLVEAVAVCGDDVRLVMVGAGPYRDDLQKQATDLGCGARVTLLDARPLTELPRLMNAFDALALPSRTTATWKEQYGRVIIEAQACGTPVIGSDSGAIPEVVGVGGLVFPEKDSAALADVIRRLRDNPEFRRALGEAGRERVGLTCTWQRVAEQMRDIYTTL